jgi:polyphosphate kinase 2 (PPK2 family)
MRGSRDPISGLQLQLGQKLPLKVQRWLKDTGQRILMLFEGRDAPESEHFLA